MLFLQVGIAIYILCMFVYLLRNYRGYVEVPKPSHLPENPPVVSLIIPTSNDAKAVRACLESIGRQDYPLLEVVVVDDHSQDDTVAVVQELAKEYSHIHLQRAETQGQIHQKWSRQTLLQHQGALAAKGEWLLFLDPNVVIKPQCVSRCVAYCLEDQIDFFSLMPGNELRSFWEKLILPIVFGWFGTRFSLSKVNDPQSSQAVAVSQFMLIRKKAYQMSGGFQDFRGEIFEDSALAREIKSLGLKYRLIGGKHLLTSRTYGGLREIWQRCVRVFIGEVGSSPLSIFWTFLVIGITGIAPFVSVLYCAYRGFDSVSPYLLFVVVFQSAAVLGARLVLDYVLGIGPFYAFLHPIGSMVALAILGSSLFQLSFGSLEHVKGRVSSEL